MGMTLTSQVRSGVIAWTLSFGSAGVWAQGAPPVTPPAPTLPIELVGAMVDGTDPSRSTCLVRCTTPEDHRRTVILEVGQPACAVAEIVEIHGDAVIVRNLQNSRLERLPLRPRSEPLRSADRASAADSAPPPRVISRAPGLVTVEVPKATVAEYLANLPDLLSSALATPHYSDSGVMRQAMDGFQLSQIRDGGVADRVGLRNGDVIVEINGEKLDSVATVLKLFGQAQTMAQVKLTITRDRQPLTVVIHTK
jgi:general secretion pathway protein C